MKCVKHCKTHSWRMIYYVAIRCKKEYIIYSDTWHVSHMANSEYIQYASYSSHVFFGFSWKKQFLLKSSSNKFNSEPVRIRTFNGSLFALSSLSFSSFVLFLHSTLLFAAQYIYGSLFHDHIIVIIHYLRIFPTQLCFSLTVRTLFHTVSFQFPYLHVHCQYLF